VGAYTDKGIVLLPYIDGRTPITALYRLFDMMTSDGTLRTVFYDGSVQRRLDFVRYFKSPSVKMFMIMRETELVGFAWLTAVQTATAMLHWCFFSNAWGKDTADIAYAASQELLKMRKEGGEYILETLLGMVPLDNERAVEFVKKAGGTVVGTIPRAIRNYWSGKLNDAVMVYMTRE